MKQEIIRRIKCVLFNFFKWFFGVTGVFFFFLLMLSFTDFPYNAYHYLGTTNAELHQKPDLIVLLGGSGMPSADGLLRIYYTAEACQKFKAAEIIIALPYNENEKDSLYQLKLMARELIIKGVDSSRIKYEPLGFNTHSQAENIARIYAPDKNSLSLLLVTSPEHMYRAVGTFRKSGFMQVAGYAAFERPSDEEKIKDKENTKDLRVRNLSFRYNMWSYLNYEVIVSREYCAIVYYKIKGWI